MTDSLTQVAAEVAACTRCPLHQGRLKPVSGEGRPDADILFIGEGPGAQEDQTGRPFVGASGKFLGELLASIGLQREDVFIANVVKCRPPNNRDPEPGEIEACRSYLERQIELISPRVIVTLGRHSMARWFPDAKISRIHGQPRPFGSYLVVPFFHPAVALYRADMRPVLEADFARLPQWIEQARALAPRGAPPPPAPLDAPDSFQQLSLF